MNRQRQLDRQMIGLLNWINNEFNGIVHWATGVGKSFMICHKEGFVSKYRKLYKSDATILIITNSVITKAQIMRELTENIPEHLIDTLIVTIHELVADKEYYKDSYYDLIIADEVDAYTSELRRVFINGEWIKKNHFLGLTATIFLIKMYYPELLKVSPVIDEISISEATDLGYIAETIEYNIGIELPEKDYETYKEYSKIIRTGINKFIQLYPYVKYINYNWNNPKTSYSDFYEMQVILNACLHGAWLFTPGMKAKEWYSKDKFITTLSSANNYSNELNPDNPIDNNTIVNWSPDNISKFCYALENALSKRNELLKTHKLKYKKVREILEELEYPETIVFSEASKYADILYRYLNVCKKDIALLYHSKAKIPIKDEKGNIKIYNSGKNKGEPRYLGTTSRKGGEISSLMEYNLVKLNTNSRVLCAVKSLSRGFNRPTIKLVITSSYTDSKTTYLQNRGRGVRLSGSDIENEKVIIINLYFKYTIEERKLRSNQSTTINQDIIKWVDENINDRKTVNVNYV